MQTRCITAIIVILLSAFNLRATDIELTKKTIDHVINLLDRDLEMRENYIESRQQHIDSLKNTLPVLRDPPTIMAIGDAYSSFDNDSAIVYFTMGEQEASSDIEVMRFWLKRLPLLPLAGFSETAVNGYESIDSSTIERSLLPLYHESGR